MGEPTWTTARLRRVLELRFPRARVGGVDTRAVAGEVGVSQRTVQRWVHGDGRRKAPIPPARLHQLRQVLAPNALHLERQRQQATYAAEALQQIHEGVELESWDRQGWLEQHRVAIVTAGDGRARRVVTGRVDATEFDSRRGGQVLAQVRVPTRFHATLLAHAVLSEVEPWRVDLRRSDAPGTTTWLADAPAVDLPALASQVVAS